MAAAAGIHAIPVPTPFSTGDMNAYLIQDDPLTLIDSGPNLAPAHRALEAGLAELGHDVRDIDLVVLTHPHADHTGLAALLRRRAGAHIAALDVAIPYVEDFHAQTGHDNKFTERLMVGNGVSRETAAAARTSADKERAWGSDVRVDVALQDGTELRLRDRTLTLAHRPGHTPYDLVLIDHASGIAFMGDHLIKETSSNALVARPPGAPEDYRGPRTQPLIELRQSLRATRLLRFDIGLAGHGDPIGNHVELVDARLAGQTRRAERISDLLADGELTAHELAQRIWGAEAARAQAYLTLSEVLGHLDLLRLDNVVRSHDDSGTTRFAAA